MDVSPGIKVPPLLELVKLLYHWFVIVPIPLATKESIGDVPPTQDGTVVMGCVVILGVQERSATNMAPHLVAVVMEFVPLPVAPAVILDAHAAPTEVLVPGWS